MASERGLGKGLGALLGDAALQSQEGGSVSLPLAQVEPGLNQPRKHFEEEALADLAESIRQHGMIQPLTVRKLSSGYYQIIAGERRWRAARLAGLTEVPAVVIEADDRKAMELAMIENLQREDLNPMEEAEGYRSLVEQYGMTQEQAVQAVALGTPIVFRGGCAPLGERQMCGKSMDDRSCFAALLRAAELLLDKSLDVDLYLLGSTGEEFSGAGAKTAAFSIAPDFCVAVDVTHGATPDGQKDRTFPLGGGPAIGVGPNMTHWMTRRMVSKAKELELDYQLEVMGGHTGTNGWYFQISREGIATSVLSVPLKYMHSPVEVLDLSDLEAAARLLAAFAQNLGKEAEALC